MDEVAPASSASSILIADWSEELLALSGRSSFSLVADFVPINYRLY